MLSLAEQVHNIFFSLPIACEGGLDTDVNSEKTPLNSNGEIGKGGLLCEGEKSLLKDKHNSDDQRINKDHQFNPLSL